MSADMPELSPKKESSAGPNATTKIELSAELHARAMLICKRRNCTLEAVIEDLVERFLPMPTDAMKTVVVKPSSLHDIMRDVPWNRWTRRRPR